MLHVISGRGYIAKGKDKIICRRKEERDKEERQRREKKKGSRKEGRTEGPHERRKHLGATAGAKIEAVMLAAAMMIMMTMMVMVVMMMMMVVEKMTTMCSLV
jgi:hypothetical protein